MEPTASPPTRARPGDLPRRDAFAEDVRVLAALLDREASTERLVALRARGFPSERTVARGGRGVEVAAMLGEAIEELGDPIAPSALDELAADYAAIFFNYTYRASPCESVWIDADGLAWQEPAFQIRAWYRKYGLGVENWRMRSDDHLVAQLHFVEILLRRSGDQTVLADLARFLDDHLLRWLPDFAARVAARCETRFYASAIAMTGIAIDELRDRIAEASNEPRATREEVERRMKPRAPQPVPQPVAYLPGAGPSW